MAIRSGGRWLMSVYLNILLGSSIAKGPGVAAETRSGGDIMELLVLWCEAQAAQRRLRDTFKDSSKPNEEPRLKGDGPVAARNSHQASRMSLTIALLATTAK